MVVGLVKKANLKKKLDEIVELTVVFSQKETHERFPVGSQVRIEVN